MSMSMNGGDGCGGKIHAWNERHHQAAASQSGRIMAGTAYADVVLWEKEQGCGVSRIVEEV